MATFYERLRQIMAEKDMGQTEVVMAAKRHGEEIHKANVNRWYNHKDAMPSGKYLVILAKIFDVNPAWLVGEDAPRHIFYSSDENISRNKRELLQLLGTADEKEVKIYLQLAKRFRETGGGDQQST